MGLLNLREISKILSKMDPKLLDDVEGSLERAKRLQAVLFDYVDAHDERKRIGITLQSGDEEGLHRFDLACEREDDILAQIREIVRSIRAT